MLLKVKTHGPSLWDEYLICLPQSNELSLGGCERWLRHMLNMMDLCSTCNSTANSSLDLHVQVPSLRDFEYDPRCLLQYERVFDLD